MKIAEIREKNKIEKMKKSGFSLIETIVAMVVLVFIFGAAARLFYILALQNQNNKNQIVATFLAQECAELARNVRDSAKMQNLNFDCAFANLASDSAVSVGDEKFFSIKNSQNLPDEISNCSTKLGAEISEIDPQNFFEKVEIDGKKTEFVRILRAKKIAADTLEILCTVRTEKMKFEILEILTDW